MNVHDLPAAIKPRSRSFSSNVQRILGMTRSFSSRGRAAKAACRAALISGLTPMDQISSPLDQPAGLFFWFYQGSFSNVN
jgi:hypothetical protein